MYVNDKTTNTDETKIDVPTDKKHADQDIS